MCNIGLEMSIATTESLKLHSRNGVAGLDRTPK